MDYEEFKRLLTHYLEKKYNDTKVFVASLQRRLLMLSLVPINSKMYYQELGRINEEYLGIDLKSRDNYKKVLLSYDKLIKDRLEELDNISAYRQSLDYDFRLRGNNMLLFLCDLLVNFDGEEDNIVIVFKKLLEAYGNDDRDDDYSLDQELFRLYQDGDFDTFGLVAKGYFESVVKDLDDKKQNILWEKLVDRFIEIERSARRGS